MPALLLGIMGMVLILLAFILDEFVPSFNQNTWRYNVLNIVGSGLLLYYAFTIQGWPFVVLNGVWLLAAVVKCVEIIREKKQLLRTGRRKPKINPRLG